MKTVGQIIFQTRKEKNISLERLSQVTKIDIDYLEALEKDHYHLLPPHTFTKGFIRNVASSLGKNPDEMVAIFRRDNPTFSALKLSPTSLPSKQKSIKKKTQTPQFGFLALVFIFIVYLVFQLRAFLIPPKLEIYQPKANTILVSPLVVEGSTSPDSIIQINDDVVIKPDHTGYFITSIPLPLGDNEIKISSTNHFSRVRTETITVTLVSQ